MGLITNLVALKATASGMALGLAIGATLATAAHVHLAQRNG